MQLILGTQEPLRIFCFFSWRIGACMHAKLLQLCTTLCDPWDCSLSGSSIHAILQARVLEWVAICSFCCYRPFQGPESGSYLTLRKRTVWGDACADKASDFIGKGTPAESTRVREPRGPALACGWQSCVLWWWHYFLGCLWPLILTQGPSWLFTNCSAKMDASEKDSGRWPDTWCLPLILLKLL